MKKTFSKVSALLLGAMLLVVGCKNAAQITFTDVNNHKLNKDGLAVLSLNIGKANQTAKTVFPSDWDENAKGKLVYRLYGSANDGESATPTVSFTKENSLFSYSEHNLKSGADTASIELDPMDWKLTLIAYEMKTPDPTSTALFDKVDPTKPVLYGKATINLSDGGTDRSIIFDLLPYNSTEVADAPADFFTPTDNTGKATAAKGKVDIQFNLEMPTGDDKLPTTVDFTITTTTEPKKTITGKSGNFAEVSGQGSTYKQVHFTTVEGGSSADSEILPDNLAPGIYNFRADFKNAKGDTVLPYMDTIVVDAGNTSKDIVYIPKNAFNGKPAKPENLKADMYFVPKANTITIKESQRIYGQKTTNNSTDLDGNLYNIDFTWSDKSVNESQFKLTLKVNGTLVTVAYAGSDKAASISGTTADLIKIADSDSAVNGKMGPGCESITLSVKMGAKITEPEIYAINTFAPDGVPSESTIADSTPIGMFTVAYKINDKNGKGLGYVQYGPLPTEKVDPAVTEGGKFEYYVHAYEFFTKESLINTEKYPYIDTTSTTCSFRHWNYEKEGTMTKVTDFAAIKAIDETLENTNITLYPSWLSPASLGVNFPTYSVYKELDVTSNHNEDKLIKPEKNESGDYVVNFSIPTVDPSVAEITNVEYTILDSTNSPSAIYTYAGLKETKKLNGVTGSDTALDINVSTWKPVGGTYTINIKYSYKDVEGNKTIPINGCFYLAIDDNLLNK